MSEEKIVDEGWKQAATQEKEKVQESYQDQKADAPEFDFRAYITSLAMQALIFLGVMPNPMNGEKIEQNLNQARLLIDTLSILREKTEGNLTDEENELLNTMLYELQVKFIEASNNPEANTE